MIFRRRLGTYHEGLKLFGDRCVAVLSKNIRNVTPILSPKSPSLKASSSAQSLNRVESLTQILSSRPPPMGSPIFSPKRRILRARTSSISLGSPSRQISFDFGSPKLSRAPSLQELPRSGQKPQRNPIPSHND
ncbi:unnamed protein product [Clavelina lepadiformis]|uniref:Uncharacterized protein n=1 Tax=Clavelina lepadiformis TaxID=159417 RepID=A0ABP0FYK0_CLALP